MSVKFQYGGLPPAMAREMERIGVQQPGAPSMPAMSLPEIPSQQSMQMPMIPQGIPAPQQQQSQGVNLGSLQQYMPQAATSMSGVQNMQNAQNMPSPSSMLQQYMPQSRSGAYSTPSMQNSGVFAQSRQQINSQNMSIVNSQKAPSQQMNMGAQQVDGGNGDFSVGEKGNGGKIAASAKALGSQFIGNSKYVWGGGRKESDIKAGRFDCSSFVHYAMKQAGKDVGKVGSTTTQTLIKTGKAVSKDDMKEGDMIFFDTNRKNGHVGIYMGDGKFIGAQGSTGVAVVDLNKDKYWSSRFKGQVRRI